MAELVQAAAAVRPDAADGDAKPGADLGVRHRRIFDQQGDQLLVTGRQVRERLAERRVSLGCQQPLLDRFGLAVRDILGVRSPY